MPPTDRCLYYDSIITLHVAIVPAVKLDYFQEKMWGSNPHRKICIVILVCTSLSRQPQLLLRILYTFKHKYITFVELGGLGFVSVCIIQCSYVMKPASNYQILTLIFWSLYTRNSAFLYSRHECTPSELRDKCRNNSDFVIINRSFLQSSQSLSANAYKIIRKTRSDVSITYVREASTPNKSQITT